MNILVENRIKEVLERKRNRRLSPRQPEVVENSPIKCCDPQVILNPHWAYYLHSHNNVYINGDEQIERPINNYGELASVKNYINTEKDWEEVDNFKFVTVEGELVPMFYIVPCGKCELCAKRRITEHVFKLVAESNYSTSLTWYITLTYKRSTEPEDGAQKRDIQLFMKKLRSKAVREYGDEGKGIRYYCVAEYGENTHRIHYHMLLFNVPKEWDDDRQIYDEVNPNTGEIVIGKNGKPFMCYKMQNVIWECWADGFVMCEPLQTQKGVRYVAKYVGKGSKTPDGKNPTFWTGSGKPGLGKEWFINNLEYIRKHPEDLTLAITDKLSGKEIHSHLPAYWKRLAYPGAAEVVKKETRESGEIFAKLAALGTAAYTYLANGETLENDYMSSIYKMPYDKYKDMVDTYHWDKWITAKERTILKSLDKAELRNIINECIAYCQTIWADVLTCYDAITTLKDSNKLLAHRKYRISLEPERMYNIKEELYKLEEEKIEQDRKKKLT